MKTGINLSIKNVCESVKTDSSFAHSWSTKYSECLLGITENVK